MLSRSCLLVAAVAATALSAAAGAGGPQEVPVFGSEVSVTRLRAAVIDARGRPITGLGADDFRVFEAGVEQPIQVLLAPEAAPLELALVLDFSGSIAEDWPQARREILAFLDALEPEDCLFVVPFNSRVGPGLWGRPDSAALRELVAGYPLEGRTRLYDAMRTALEAVGEGSEARTAVCGADSDTARRRGLVMLSDGMDEGSQASYAEVLLDAWRAGVPSFPVAVGTAAIGDNDLRGWRDHFYGGDVVEQIRTFQDQLREIARVSGGSFVNKRDLREAYAELLSLLRTYYVIGYRSSADNAPGWREVSVALRRGRGRVLAQDGYYRGDAKAGAARQATDTAAASFEGRRFDEAARWFAIAAGLSADVGRPFFGRGLAMEAAGNLSEARTSYARSLQQNPGIAATHIRLGMVLNALGDTGAASDHAIRAEFGGGDTEQLWSRLAERGVARPPRSALERPVLFIVHPESPGLLEQLALREVQRELGAIVDSTAGVALTRWYPSADHYLVTLPLDYDPGPPETIRVRFELYDLGRNRLFRTDRAVADMADVAAIAQIAAQVGAEIAERLASR